jgi:hypothetical protein
MSGKRPGRRGKAAAAAAPAAPVQPEPEPQQEVAVEQEQAPADDTQAPAITKAVTKTQTQPTRDEKPPAVEEEDFSKDIKEALNYSDENHVNSPVRYPFDEHDAAGPTTSKFLPRLASTYHVLSHSILPHLVSLLLLICLLTGSYVAYAANSSARSKMTELQSQLRATNSKLSALEKSSQQVVNLASAVQSLSAVVQDVQQLQQWQQEAAGSLNITSQDTSSLKTDLSSIKLHLGNLTEQLAAAAEALASSPNASIIAATIQSLAPVPVPSPEPTTFWHDASFKAAAVKALQGDIIPMQSSQLAESITAHSSLPDGIPLAVKLQRVRWSIMHSSSQPFLHPLADELLLTAHIAKPGMCLPLEQASGASYVDIKLRKGTQKPVAAVSLHLPVDLLDVSSTPKQFDVHTFNDSSISASSSSSADGSVQTGMQQQGSFLLEPAANKQQYTFILTQPEPAAYLRLRVLSNQGDKQHSCLYRVAVHEGQ